MTRDNGQRDPLASALPGSALLIAPTIERAAVLGVAFDHAVAATPDELSGVLATAGPNLPCVAISGVPTRGGRLAEVLRQVQASSPRDVQILIDLRDPAGNDLFLHGAQALRGLVPVDRIEVWGIPCLRLRRAPERSFTPDLQSWRAALLDGAASQGIGGPNHRPGPEDEARSLRERVVELEQELAGLRQRTEVPRAESRAAPSDRTQPAGTSSRIRRLLPGGQFRARRLVQLLAVMGIGTAVLVIAAIALADATDSGYVGGAVTIAVGLICSQFGYVWRGQARLVTRIERLARRNDDSGTARYAAIERMLITQQTRLKEIEHDLAIMAASTVDIAHSVANQRTQQNGD